MAAKRISQSNINWSALSERVPTHQKSSFLAFKSRSDKYLRAVLANPEQSPKIDWAAYKSKIPNAALVESFQKAYESLKVPYPADTLSAEVDKLRGEMISEIATFKKESEARIVNYKAETDRIKGLLPYAQMTMEDFRDAHPELALDPLNKPTFWPHEPELQPDACKEEKAHH
ncbi:ATP synthase subunit d, mitochondrial-like [Contarinia nasturtii]|uniref:ATP synthase subunit d, mitochondrial-like n=1 Tax=Contarinia nasturtii TaxID=265458 RepID=UPI0012D4793D|nr:ATP synthase subunit d, mitochondrial-like [Contarinia nasturtii]